MNMGPPWGTPVTALYSSWTSKLVSVAPEYFESMKLGVDKQVAEIAVKSTAI